MNRTRLHSLRTSLLAAAVSIVMAVGGSSCNDFVYEDMPECPQGLRLRFIYDYNMEFANAFPSQVHCLTVLVYDSEGHYLQSRTVTDGALLGDENWRMTLDLPAGTYKLIAYGGMECADASFAFRPQPGAGVPMTDVEVALKPELLTGSEGKKLHDLFYGPYSGPLTVTVPDDGIDYTDATVEMMKDTNNVRIVLQNIDGTTVNSADFTYSITDDNTLLAWNNAVVPTGATHYRPWAWGQAVAGTDVETGADVEVAYAEFSTSRFTSTASARLDITRVADGSKVFSIPLVNYLLLLKSQQYDWMGAQEFLDRESRWNMVFFLDDNQRWITTQIIINGWVVRINNISGM